MYREIIFNTLFFLYNTHFKFYTLNSSILYKISMLNLVISMNMLQFWSCDLYMTCSVEQGTGSVGRGVLDSLDSAWSGGLAVPGDEG